MKVRWSTPAKRDRATILEYLAARDRTGALRIDRLFSEATARLAAYPKLGHEGGVAGTRELTPHPSYRLIYDLDEDTIRNLALVHAARKWPPIA